MNEPGPPSRETLVPCVEEIYVKLINALGQAFYFDWASLFPEDAVLDAAPSTSRKKPPEDELAATLCLPIRPVRKFLRLLETHGVLAREHRKQKKRKRERAGQEKDEDEEDEEGLQENADQGLLLSYSSVDYQHTYDITRLRLYIMRQSLKAELEDRKAVQEYQCVRSDCEDRRVFTTLQILEILDQTDGTLRCPNCKSILEAKNEDVDNKGLSRRDRAQRVKQKQEALEEAFRPLVALLGQIEAHLTRGDDIPDFGTLNQYQAREAERRSTQSFRGPDDEHATRVDIDMGGVTVVKSDAGPEAAPREVPPWLRAQQAKQAGRLPAAFTDNTAQVDLKIGLKKDEAKNEDEYERKYKERIAKLDAEKLEIPGHTPANGGWQEVGPLPSEAPTVKQELNGGLAQATGNGAEASAEVEEEEDWEDA